MDGWTRVGKELIRTRLGQGQETWTRVTELLTIN